MSYLTQRIPYLFTRTLSLHISSFRIKQLFSPFSLSPSLCHFNFTRQYSTMSIKRELPTHMRIIQADDYGPPQQVLHLRNVPLPTIKPGHVLIRVRAASVHAGDWRLVRGDPYLIRLMYGGLRKPAISIPGCDICGVIQSIADDITDFEIGDEVFGDLSECGFGAFSEYVVVPKIAIVKKPKNVSIQQAAVSGVSTLAALHAIREAKVEGKQVLIHGASGGVGTFAVQLAKHFGASKVWAVCHKRKSEVIRKLGADSIVDYTEQDVLDLDEKFDIIIDTACFQSPTAYSRILVPGGKFIIVGGATSRIFQTLIFGPLLSITKKMDVKCIMSKPNQNDLLEIADLLSKGVITPHIDRRFTLEQVPEAIAYIESRKVTGKIAILLG